MNQTSKSKQFRPGTRRPRRKPLSPRYLSIQQPALAENIARFRSIHESAVGQRWHEEGLGRGVNAS